MQKEKISDKALIIIICATIAFIWIHSIMPTDMSSNESGLVMKIIQPVLELFVGKGNVTEHLVRKMAHFIEYFVLGSELTFFFNRKKLPQFPKAVATIIFPLGISLTVASIDEFIQIFSNRGPMVQDVLLDFCGALTAYIIVRIILRAVRPA